MSNVCASCRTGSHQHDRHTGLAPGTRRGDDAGCPNSVGGDPSRDCECAVVLAPIGGGRRHCETCRCAS